MRVTSLGSSSSGNAFLIEAGPRRRTKLLVDAGFPGRILAARLQLVDVALRQLQGVLVTHEHTDHIVGLPTLVKRHTVPIVADPRTLAAIDRVFAHGMCRTDTGALAPLGNEEYPVIELADSSSSLPIGSHYTIGDIEVESFPVSHDAVAPCGYLLSAGGCRACIVIDSGEVTPVMLEAMQQADLLILESNHDREKLLRGPYPYALKQRILSPTGHLSNDQAADAVLRTWHTDSVRWLWLAHLSRTNNTPKIALRHMLSRIQAAGASPTQVHVTVLQPDMGGVWDSTQLWESAALWEM